MHTDEIEAPTLAGQRCPDCGRKNLMLYESGRVHCGKCLMGGSLRASKYADLRRAAEAQQLAVIGDK